MNTSKVGFCTVKQNHVYKCFKNRVLYSQVIFIEGRGFPKLDKIILMNISKVGSCMVEQNYIYKCFEDKVSYGQTRSYL